MASARIAVIVILGSFVAVAGCAVPTAEEESGVGDVGESSDALSSPCALSRAQILAASSGGRREAITRGFTWLDAHVPYSQTRNYEGYRTDCSGFVSMCWKTGTSYTTASFISGSASSSLPSYESLQPADALVYRSGGRGHITLFLGWNQAAHTSACVLEQASTASDMQFRTRTVASLKATGFKPIRADSLPAQAASAPNTPTGADEPRAPSNPQRPPPDGDPQTPEPLPADPASTGGCYSPTMGRTMPEASCVRSAADQVIEQCHDGLWYRGVAGGEGPYGACTQ